MKYHTTIPFFIIFCSLVPATLQCSTSEKIKRSSTIGAIQQINNYDSDENYERLNQHGLLGRLPEVAFRKHKEKTKGPSQPTTIQEALKKHQEEAKKPIEKTKDLSQATSAQEAVEIFNQPYIQKKSGNLNIMQYAVLSELPMIVLLLLDAGYSINPIDEMRLKTQLKIVDQKQGRQKNRKRYKL